MTIVVDASVIVAFLTASGPEGNWAESVVSKGDLAAPDIVFPEASNVLRRLGLSGRLPWADASEAHQDLARLEISLFSFIPFSQRVWELRHNLSSYDAWYVAVAELLDCPLATLDLRLSRARGPDCRIITPPDPLAISDSA